MPSTTDTPLYAEHLHIIAARFEQALAAAGHGAVLLSSGPQVPIFRDDQPYPFRAHAWFKAWAPLTQVPDCLLYFQPGGRPLLLFHAPEDFWYESAALPTDPWTAHFDLRAVPTLEAARAALPQQLGHTAYIGEPFAGLAAWGVGVVNPAALLARLDFDRAVKTPWELAQLRAANRLGARGHRAAAAAFAGGASEFEIHLAFLAACGQREQELPYNAIVALNEAGSILHYQNLRRASPAVHHSLLIDAGAEAAGYASDITRTHSADPEFAALIRRFDRLQQQLCATVRPGVDWRDVHLTSHRMIGELLQEVGITRCDAAEAVDRGVTSVFMPHGIGHLLGLQVHDAAGRQESPEGGEIPRPKGHPYLRLTRRLESGFVVTMEPGIYFIEPLLAQARAEHAHRIDWGRVDFLRRFGGIRIEDDLAVTTEGCENLTRDAFAATS